MDYEISHRDKDPYDDISYTIDIGGRYGKMPNEALTDKFEETIYDNSEYDYENFARLTLTDRGPDARSLESDAPRLANLGRGVINHRYYGSYGGEENPRHPEMFLGITEREPRRTFVDPDMRELRKQGEARMRFIRWYPDADHSTTGGSRSEAEVRDQYAVIQKLMTPRWRIFSTSLDGRREGLRRDWKYRSPIDQVDAVDAVNHYGDYIRDYALNPQRKTTILSNLPHRLQKIYNLFTTDHEFAVAKYGQDSRHQKLTGQVESVLRGIDSDGHFIDTRLTRDYKTAGLLMGVVVSQFAADGDISREDTPGSNKLAIRKRERDQVIALLKELQSNEQFLGDGRSNTVSKSLESNSHLPHGKNLVSNDTLKPAHHYLNAEMMYRSVKPGADIHETLNLIDNETQHNATNDNSSKYTKTSPFDPNGTYSNASQTVEETNRTEPMKVHNYKSAQSKHIANSGLTYDMTAKSERFGGESSKTQMRTVQHNNWNVVDARNISTDKDFSDNYSKERHSGKMGIKSRARRYSIMSEDFSQLE